MEARAEPAWIEPYLDRELGPVETVLLEKALLQDPPFQTLFLARKSFHDFLKRSLGAVQPSPGLNERIRDRLAREDADAFAPAATRPRVPRSRWWRFAAAVLLACGGLVTYQLLCPPLGLCRYVAACTGEHRRVVLGQLPLVVDSSDRSELARYALQRVPAGMNLAPALDGFRLVGVGTSDFQQLRHLNPPVGIFFRYEDGRGRPLLLFVHAWASERPTVAEVEYGGLRYWFTERGGVGFVGWKTNDGKVLCSLTGECAGPELMHLAAEARSSFRAQEQLSATPARSR